MTARKPLPENPSLDYERKQAKALRRLVNTGDAEATARVHQQFADCDLPISLRDAQFVLAREYGYPGWSELKSAILRAQSTDLEVIYRQACEAIDANDIEHLGELLGKCPALLTYRQSQWPEVLLQQTTSYANFPGADNEDHYNRPDAAELLLEADAVMDPRVYLRLIDTGAHKMLALFESKGVLPNNLRVLAALGDLQRVVQCFDDTGILLDLGRPSRHLLEAYEGASADWPDPDDDYEIIADALLYACRLAHREIAEFLLTRCLTLDADLDRRIEDWNGRSEFLDFMITHVPEGARHGQFRDRAREEPGIVWQRAVELRLQDAQNQGDVETFRELLKDEDFLLGARYADTQSGMLEVAAYSEDARDFIAVVLDSDAAIVSMNSPPKSRAISHALEYGHRDYVPLLSRVWSVPDDLPHAAGMGDLLGVKKWFDAQGIPAIDPKDHNPYPEHFPHPSQQDVLDRSLAWAVINREYEIAEYLLDRGADINTRWSTHEPASILHECAYHGRLEQVQFLVAKGIDLTIRDYRHDSTAEGWARFAGQTDVADLLAAVRQGKRGTG